MRTEPFPLLLDWGVVSTLPPALTFFGAALLLALARGPRLGGLRRAIVLGTPLLGLVNLTVLAPGASLAATVLGLDFVHLRVDRLSLLFGLLLHIGAFIGALYSLRVRDTTQQVAALVYAGSALGAVFAGDLLTLFGYWEAMAVSSAFLIWASRSAESGAAGLRYLALQLASGLLLLAGALAQFRATGTIAFELTSLDAAAGWFLLAAFGIKCGFPLVHTWITDAYPRATATGTVSLSMFTTKVAVYALARGFAGTELLVPIGTAMAVFPIFYAVIENDLRRVLGYSMINQIGFMVAGVGIGTELALNGAVAHAFNEVLFKGLLFMSMGAVLVRVKHVLGSDLGGLYKSMPLTTLFCIVGAASISAFPLFNGFVSKSMIMAAMTEAGFSWIWLAFLFASAGVFHHAGIKIPYFAFFAHDAGLRPREAPPSMLAAMGLAAGLCVLVGCFPSLLYALLPWSVDYVPYTYAHVVAQLQLLLFSALAFAWLQLTGVYPAELRSVNLDADWLYRLGLPRLLRHGAGSARALTASAASVARAVQAPVADSGGQWLRALRAADPALWAGGLLAGYLLIYYVSQEA